jgi:hypothetical protein
MEQDVILRLCELAHIDPHVKNDACVMWTPQGSISTQDLPSIRAPEKTVDRDID